MLVRIVDRRVDRYLVGVQTPTARFQDFDLSVSRCGLAWELLDETCLPLVQPQCLVLSWSLICVEQRLLLLLSSRGPITVFIQILKARPLALRPRFSIHVTFPIDPWALVLFTINILDRLADEMLFIHFITHDCGRVLESAILLFLFHMLDLLSLRKSLRL